MAILDIIHRDRQAKEPLSLLQNAINKLFDEFLDDASGTHWTKNRVFPAIDIIENHKNVRVKIELPGMSAEDVDILASHGFLTIKGSKKSETTDKNDSFLRHEVSYGAFQRIVALPYHTDTDKAEIKFNNGVLTIEIPHKTETVQNAKKLQIPKAA